MRYLCVYKTTSKFSYILVYKYQTNEQLATNFHERAPKIANDNQNNS